MRCYHSGPEWTRERWRWRGTPHSPKLQLCWKLSIRLFSVISRTLFGGSYPSAEVQSVYSTAPADWAIQNLSLTIRLVNVIRALFVGGGFPFWRDAVGVFFSISRFCFEWIVLIELLISNSNAWNHLTVNKLALTFLQIRLPTNYSFTNLICRILEPCANKCAILD